MLEKKSFMDTNKLFYVKANVPIWLAISILKDLVSEKFTIHLLINSITKNNKITNIVLLSSRKCIVIWSTPNKRIRSSLTSDQAALNKKRDEREQKKKRTEHVLALVPANFRTEFVFNKGSLNTAPNGPSTRTACYAGQGVDRR